MLWCCFFVVVFFLRSNSRGEFYCERRISIGSVCFTSFRSRESAEQKRFCEDVVHRCVPLLDVGQEHSVDFGQEYFVGGKLVRYGRWSWCTGGKVEPLMW